MSAKIKFFESKIYCVEGLLPKNVPDTLLSELASHGSDLELELTETECFIRSNEKKDLDLSNFDVYLLIQKVASQRTVSFLGRDGASVGERGGDVTF